MCVCVCVCVCGGGEGFFFFFFFFFFSRVQKYPLRVVDLLGEPRSCFARVNAVCNLSRKKSQEVAASLLGRFLSRRCFTLCTTMKVEHRIAKQ